MKNFRLLLIIAIPVIFFFIYWRLNISYQTQDFNKFLLQRFTEGFTSKALRTKDFRIIMAEKTRSPILPVVAVFRDNLTNPDEIYEIDSHSPDQVKGFLRMEKWVNVNIDDDPEDEIISEWELDWGGSGGLKSLVVFDVNGDKITPVLGYPMDLKVRDDQIIVKGLKDKGDYRFPVVVSDSFTEYSDINGDGKAELLYGNYYWDLKDPLESHFSPHPWDLSVYEFTDKGLTVSPRWNAGRVYRTNEKIGFEETDREKIIRLFREKLTDN